MISNIENNTQKIKKIQLNKNIGTNLKIPTNIKKH